MLGDISKTNLDCFQLAGDYEVDIFVNNIMIKQSHFCDSHHFHYIVKTNISIWFNDPIISVVFSIPSVCIIA